MFSASYPKAIKLFALSRSREVGVLGDVLALSADIGSHLWITMSVWDSAREYANPEYVVPKSIATTTSAGSSSIENKSSLYFTKLK